MTSTTHLVRFSDDELRLLRYALESHLLLRGQFADSDPAWTLPYRQLLGKIVGQMNGTDQRISDDAVRFVWNPVQAEDHHKRRLSDLFELGRRDLPPTPSRTLPAPFDFLMTKEDDE